MQKIRPYLMLGGRADEAAEFYRAAVGAEVRMRMTFSEAPDPAPPGMLAPDWGGKVMHMELNAAGAEFFMSDGMGPASNHCTGYSLALSVATPERARHCFEALAAGGSIGMPIGPSFFSPAFGMLTDRFGVEWMVIAEAPPPAGAGRP